ncbi:MAG: serine O-acetyltransferase [Pseudomonadales bacterium]|jgi:serine O-acetyltransferase|nr:serine O-acetyltransferase [Pseudomonadales bacterium]
MSGDLWKIIRDEISTQLLDEPDMGGYFSRRILRHDSLCSAIADLLASKLTCCDMPESTLRQVITQAHLSDPGIVTALENDLLAVRQRDAAVRHYSTALLYFKGFQALQAYRVAHWLWQQERSAMALYLQSRISAVFTVDIHPAARIGCGILVDHATGIVIGETCVLDDNISILQGVTLGGTGKDTGDRHPKIRSGVLLSAGAIVLGNVVIGEGAKIAAGSVVLHDVEPHTTVAGVPAVKVGKPRAAAPALDMNHDLNHGEERG